MKISPTLFSLSSRRIVWTGNFLSSFSISVDGVQKSITTSGSITVSGFGSHNIEYEAVFTGLNSSLNITLDGVTVVNETAQTRQVTESVPKPCAEYQIDSARDSCKSGYSRTSKTAWLITLTLEHVDSSATKTDYIPTSGIPKIQPEPTGSSLPRVGAVFGKWEVKTVIKTSSSYYFCTPTSSCTDSEQTTTSELITDISDSFSISVTESSSEIAARLAEEKRERDQEIERILVQSQIQQAALQQTKTVKPISISESQDTKYRIISPLIYDIIDNKRVPEIQYESVRLLSPESVASYVARGYEIQMVSQDTPLSYSKPYGGSIISRTKILTENLKQNTLIPKGRSTIQELSRLNPVIPKKGNTIVRRSRDNTRISE